MPEVILGAKAALGIFVTGVSSFFWMAGGRSNDELKIVHMDLFGWDKANRFWGRAFAPFLFITGVTTLFLMKYSLEWRLFAFFALFPLVSTLGHGNTQERVIKAILWVSSAIPLCMISGHYLTLIPAYTFALTAQLVLGGTKLFSAPIEELTIYFCMNVFIPFMVL